MRIALLTDGVYPYVIGGMQKHSFQLAQYFAENGHTVYLFHCNESDYDISKLEFFTDKQRQHIKSIVIPFPHKKYFPFHYLYESWLYSKIIKQSFEQLDAPVDFIIAQGFCAWALLKDKYSKKLPPVAVHFHGLEMFQKVPSAKAEISKYLLRDIVKKTLALADYAISYGGKITDILRSIVPEEKIWVIPGWIEKSWNTINNKQQDSTVKFVFMGRYERRKGIDELNEAIKNLSTNADFTFDFIGPIPENKKLKLPGINYQGQISSVEKIKEILSSSDVFVCPSYAEGMPNVIMEAMSCGLAIIATDVGAVSLFVNNENGWLLKSPEVSGLALALKQAIGSLGADLDKKKNNSAQKIKKFLMEDIMNDLIQKIYIAIKKVSSPD